MVFKKKQHINNESTSEKKQNFLSLCCSICVCQGVCVWGVGANVQAAEAPGCFLLTSHGCRMTFNVLICKARLPKQRVRSDPRAFTDGRKAPVFCATRLLQGKTFSFLPALSSKRSKMTCYFTVN